jgi:hypothetical protein
MGVARQRVYANTRLIAIQAFEWMGGHVRVLVVQMLFLSVITNCVWAQDASDPGTAASIRALEKQWTVGQSRNDNRALDLIFDNALVYVEYGRLVTKGEYLARIKSVSPEVDQIAMEPMTVRTFGTTAVVVGSYVEKQRDQEKRTIQRWKFVDTWVYKKNGWVLVAAAAAPVSNE